MVYSARSVPGYVSSQKVEDTSEQGFHDLWTAVREAAAMPNSSRLPSRGVVPLSAVPAARALQHGAFHGRDWEIKLRERHARRMGDERDENTAAARISEQERRDFASSRRRQWVTSSRRFIEARKSAPPKTAAEREEIRNRLYSARRKIAPRVYA